MNKQGSASALSIRDVIQIGILLISMGTIYGIMSNRLATTESNLQDFQRRYEREVVPRAEHIQMNAVLEQRLSAIIESQKNQDGKIESIELKIDQILQKK